MPLGGFTPQVRDWFLRSFEGPTEAQAQAWPAIARGENVLLSAPTGSGKTLAAFLWALDRFVAEAGEGTRLVYVSPLKALSYDIERNLRAPLKGIGADVKVGIRTGDTPQREQLAEEPLQRVALSATQRRLEEVARFVVGPRRTCTVIDTGMRKPLDLEIRVPVEDMTEPDAEVDLNEVIDGTSATRRSIWPAIYPELLELVKSHRSTIVFVNNRRSAERLALRPNGPAAEGAPGKGGA